MFDNRWKTVVCLKLADNVKSAAAINQKGSRFQVTFGASVSDGRIGGRFLPLPSSSNDVNEWVEDMHALIDAIGERAKPLLDGVQKVNKPDKARQKKQASGLRALARKDAERNGVTGDLSEKERERKEKKPKKSKQDKAARDREIRSAMKERKGSR